MRHRKRGRVRETDKETECQRVRENEIDKERGRKRGSCRHRQTLKVWGFSIIGDGCNDKEIDVSIISEKKLKGYWG